MRKKKLAILLSQLESSRTYSASLEQYPTDPSAAADILWHLADHESLSEKIVADFGCGNGILGIGALLLGAKKVLFVDIDSASLDLARKNLRTLEAITKKVFTADFFQSPITSFHHSADLVIQNPPFGVQREHADKMFLLAAFRSSPLIYSLHKLESKQFLDSFSRDHGYHAELLLTFHLPLRRTQRFHTKKRHFVDIGLWRIEKLKKIS
ncbi:MAG: METTL5 family protein [Nanoarchaeota archaeon]|mgnify:FL=1